MSQPMTSVAARRRWLLVALGLAGLLSAVCLAMPNDQGTWVCSGHDDCPAGKECAVWEMPTIPTWDGACCIEKSALGTHNLYACDSAFRHGHGGE